MPRLTITITENDLRIAVKTAVDNQGLRGLVIADQVVEVIIEQALRHGTVTNG